MSRARYCHRARLFAPRGGVAASRPPVGVGRAAAPRRSGTRDDNLIPFLPTRRLFALLFLPPFSSLQMLLSSFVLRDDLMKLNLYVGRIGIILYTFFMVCIAVFRIVPIMPPQNYFNRRRSESGTYFCRKFWHPFVKRTFQYTGFGKPRLIILKQCGCEILRLNITAFLSITGLPCCYVAEIASQCGLHKIITLALKTH